MGYTIIVRANGKAPQQLELTAGKTVLGREAGDIILGDPMSSSTHAELHWDGNHLLYKDLSSTNGSFLNGQRISQVELMPGMTVMVGQSSVQFVGVSGDATRGRTMIAPPSARPDLATGRMQAATATTQMPRSSGSRPVIIAIAVGLVLLGVTGLGGAVMFRNAMGNKGASAGASTGSSSPSVGSLSPSLPSLLGGNSAKGGEVTVKAVWFSGTPGVKVSGGTSDINVRISPNSKEGASVGVIEEFSGGTGNQWRTATWLAAFNASRVTGHSLIEHEYLVRAGGHIDGPSAGMLMTSTMMALLNGKSLLPNTTMTGTINPDGSAGPVGGIVQKMRGSKESGIKRFGYPMGARNHMDLSDKTMVDLNDVGASLGMEVREIHDLYEAYEFMTGDTLKRPTPVDESTMELDAETAGKLRAKMTGWKAKVDGEVAQLKEALRKKPQIGKVIGPQLLEIEEHLKKAETMEKSDLPAAALQEYVGSEFLLVMARDMMEFIDRYFVNKDLASVVAQIDAATAVGGQVRAFGDELLIRSKKTSVGGQVNATLAFNAYVTAANFTEMGEEGKQRAGQVIAAIKSGKLQASQQTEAYLVQNLMMPIVYYHLAGVLLDLARDNQDLVSEEGQAAAANLSVMGREAGAYGSAAGAALNYFDALITEELSKEKSMTKADAQEAVANKELPYSLAQRGVALTENIKPESGDSAKNLMRLAAGVGAYFTAAGLVNKYYALGAVERDGVITIQNRKSLTAQLEQARLHAREAAGRARAEVGFVPITARLSYQEAGALREGSDRDKLDALTAYWQSAFLSELAAKLAAAK